jgi:hypothetical protein
MLVVLFPSCLLNKEVPWPTTLVVLCDTWRVFTNNKLLELKSNSPITSGLEKPFRKKTAISISNHDVRRGKLTSWIMFVIKETL